MYPSQWPDVLRLTVDYCAFGSVMQKAIDIWTSLKSWKPMGVTGDGRCRGKCGQGSWHADKNGCLHFRHNRKLGHQPKDGYTGPGAAAMKNSIPRDLVSEWLEAAQRESHDTDKKVVIDLCCGQQSVRSAVEDRGLIYIGVDIRGDLC